jgi:hypothetical protein
MADAREVFRNGSDARRQSLGRFWPELYNALAGLGSDGKPVETRSVWCVVGSVEHLKARVPAVGRLARMGHPACAEHIEQLADRPGGWPLPAEENKR